jgi:hypothetical protein
LLNAVHDTGYASDLIANTQETDSDIAEKVEARKNAPVDVSPNTVIQQQPERESLKNRKGKVHLISKRH